MADRYEINFAPRKRFIRGEHQMDLGYFLSAESDVEARSLAIHWLKRDFPSHASNYGLSICRKVPVA